MPDEDADLSTMVDAVFSEDLNREDGLKAWLALWSEVPNNTTLQAAHRDYYTRYKNRVILAIDRAARGRNMPITTERLALMFISLVDGLWLEWAIDSGRVSPETARTACCDLLEAFLGPISRAKVH